MTFSHVHRLSDVNDRTSPTAVAIGSFDGVHLGHQKLLRKMVATARSDQMRTAVLTFFPHPKRVLIGQAGRYYLSTLSERVALLKELGIDLVITPPFNEEVRHTKAADFVDQLLHILNMRQLWGGNFALGYDREGDIPFLRKLGQERNYRVKQVKSMVSWNGEVVSSSRVRRSLRAGNVEDVKGCLGRPYCVSGTVVKGDQRGRTIGFPTANLAEWVEQLLPANGVYATFAWLGEQCHVAATNVGVRPTVNGGNVTVETHLLDFDGDLYDEHVSVEFIRRIRPEQKFSDLDALKNQIKMDVARIRSLLS